ncbi:MAG TPA: copper amine oxidase N-terminal domain-containing protein, partial [Symbiobacteriaceae bacterium]|nr:copper amine oxidase N-terminal domain-containing protein [Symbiobacteriaceae bacterium]
MLPLRAVVEAAGGTVTWNAEQWAVAVQLNGNASLVRIGQVTADAAGPAPQIVDGYTLVSVAFLQNLGLEVRWQGSVLHLSRPEGGSNAQ